MSLAQRAHAETSTSGDGRTLGWWGMALFIATETVLFGSLLSGYFYARVSSQGGWPPAGIDLPRLQLVIPATVLLLSSSGPAILAEGFIRQGREGALRVALGLTMLMGLTFLGIQGWEYAHASTGPRTHVYSSLFFTITGAHGLHVVAGLLMLGFVQARAWAGHFGPQRHEAVSNVTLYWHFVDAVWIVVFLSLYISPRVS